MLTRPFLTELDSRAAVKGSVDPLGIQAIWVHLGRYVVGNLTTVSTSARDFTILLVGYWLAQRVQERAPGANDLGTMLKWEQLASYARAHVLGETSFRGTARVGQRLESGTTVTLGADTDCQTLASQRSYGIFGLYTQAARASGWIDADAPRLTPAGVEIVERHLLGRLERAAGRGARTLVERLGEERIKIDLAGRDRALTAAVAEVVKAHVDSPALRDAYREHLLFGGPEDPTHGVQRAYARALEPYLAREDFAFDAQVLEQLAERAESAAIASPVLAERLRAIRDCEAVMAPAAALFSHVVQRGDATVSEVAADVRDAWGSRLPGIAPERFSTWRDEVRAATGSDEQTLAFTKLGNELADADYEGAVRTLLMQNAGVMRDRGGAAWVEEQRGRLRVRLRYEEGRLPTREALPTLFRHAYFLESVRSMGHQLGLA